MAACCNLLRQPCPAFYIKERLSCMNIAYHNIGGAIPMNGAGVFFGAAL
jgi:hypothetical protein